MIFTKQTNWKRWIVPQAVVHAALISLAAIGVWTPIAAKADGPVISLSPSSLDFGQVVIGQGFSELVILLNTGTTTLHVSSISVSAGFVLPPGNCPVGDYPVGSGCKIGVLPDPQNAGVATGEVTIVDNAPGSPHVIPLRVKGTYVRFSPPNLGFGTVFPGRRQSRNVSVTNTSTTAISINGMATAGPSKDQFQIEGETCGSSLVGGATCDIKVAFAPSVFGKSPAALLLGSSQGGSPNTIGLTGNATQLSFDPDVLNFGRVSSGSKTTRTVAVTNLGDTPVNFLNFQITGPATGSYIIQGNTCGATLAPQASCDVTVQIFPAFPGVLQSSLVIHDDAAASPQSVMLIAIWR